MSKEIIPKEQLTAYQRWELVSFDAPPPPPAPATSAQATSNQAPAEPKVHLPTAAEMAAQLEQARQQAWQEGMQQGQEEGYQQGYQEGYQQGYQQGEQQAQAELAQLQALLENLHASLNQFDGEIAQSLLQLALEIARKMICTALQVKPELIMPVISEAIANLPHFNQHAHLFLHPDDAALVREKMSEQLGQAGWKIFNDQQLERGGCRLETSTSQIDASNATRWQHIMASIGEDKSWLE